MLDSSQLRSGNEDVSWIAEAAVIRLSSALFNDHLNGFSSSDIGEIDEGANRHSRDNGINLSNLLNQPDSSDRILAVDEAVINHVRWLLNLMDLKALVAVSVKMDFPLNEWLKRELKGKNASHPFLRDFGTRIMAFHILFQCTQPDLVYFIRAIKFFNLERCSREIFQLVKGVVR